MWYLLITSASGHTVYASQAFITEGEALDAQDRTVGHTSVCWGRPKRPPTRVEL